MFLSTIGLTTDKTIGAVLSKSGGFRINDVSDKRGKAEPGKSRETSDLVNLQVATQVTVTIDEVMRPTGFIFLQNIIYQQCSRTSVAGMKMLRFLTHITTRK